MSEKPEGSLLTSREMSEYDEFLRNHDHSVTYVLTILEDIYNMNAEYGYVDYLRDRTTIERRFSHEGLAFLTKTLPAFFDSVLNYLETGISAYPGYKIRKGMYRPEFLQQLTLPIYEKPYEVDTAKTLGQIYQLCVAFKKLKGPYRKKDLVHQLDKFIETDQSTTLDFSDDDNNILDSARDIITEVLSNLNPHDIDQASAFRPRPGPGATNSPTERHTRYRPHMRDPQLSSFPFREWYSIPVTGPRLADPRCNNEISCAFPRRYTAKPWSTQVGKQISFSDIKEREILTSRLKFVHKTFGKARVICIEQLEMQWLQQALRRALYARIESHPLTRGYVNFTDQSTNGLIALRSSELLCKHLNKYATIDMSEGSDRVFRSVVERLFGGVPELLNALLDLSTRVIELPKDLDYHIKSIESRKYAPMGSALCFPVMGLVHYALVKSIISNEQTTAPKNSHVWVYGDDIIVHCRHAKTVCNTLPHFGMKINVSKSYSKSLFRESCGVHAYNGVNITPVRFKSILHKPLSIANVVTSIQDEYHLFYKGYTKTAALIRSDISKFPQIKAKSLPFVGPKSRVFGFIRERRDICLRDAVYGLKRKWMSAESSLLSVEDKTMPKFTYQKFLACGKQRFSYLVRLFVDKTDKSPPVSDEEYYLRKLVENSENSRMIDGAPLGTTIQWQWVPDSAFDCS